MVLKELLDNSLDIAPVIAITLGERSPVEDNAPGLPADVVADVLDFGRTSGRTWDKAHAVMAEPAHRRGATT